jgi:hypothetical protein
VSVCDRSAGTYFIVGIIISLLAVRKNIRAIAALLTQHMEHTRLVSAVADFEVVA